MEEWVAEIRFAADVEAKIKTKHGLTVAQIKEAVLCGADEKSGWHKHPRYGWRLFLMGTDSTGARMLVYVRPIDRVDGIWECVTAWKVD